MSTIKVNVAARIRETRDIAVFELVSPDREPLPQFTAGAHVDVHMPNGIVRQYSLCNAPHERDRYVIAVLNAAQSRGGSRAMHEQVHVGTQIEISAPRNNFPLVGGAGRSVLIAGGIGVTPLLCMGEHLSRTGGAYELHYCARSREQAAFRDRLASPAFARNVKFHFDDGPAEQKFDAPRVLRAANPGDHLYVCGPQGFMDAVLEEAQSQGWPADSLHYEFFSGRTAAAGADQPFDLKIASTGRIVSVPVHLTAAQALNAAGVEVPTSCGEGVCGTCIVRVLEGVPDHRDLYFSPEEHAANDQFTPCCSRAKSPLLVLDL